LLRRLAGGGQCNLAALATELGIGEPAVAAALADLADRGLPIRQSGRDRYCLEYPIELLGKEAIWAGLESQARDWLEAIDVLQEVDSTNAWLLDRPGCKPGRGRACLAEVQHAGRGRRGRHWVAPPGGSLCLSLGWNVADVPRDISSLGLVCGVAAVNALEALGVPGTGLKWPNDLEWCGRKLGGVLVETRSSGSGSMDLVMGLGLNLRLGPQGDRIDTGWGGPPADLAEIMGGNPPGRNVLAAELLNCLARSLQIFSGSGFASFRPGWERMDSLRHKTVQVRTGASCVTGIASGVDDMGALQLQVGGRMIPCLAGEVSVRLANATSD
jgi:BirA family biotin operon repressor/biotin-[acetyl-CoA-carboxylase] ligase